MSPIFSTQGDFLLAIKSVTEESNDLVEPNSTRIGISLLRASELTKKLFNTVSEAEDWYISQIEPVIIDSAQLMSSPEYQPLLQLVNRGMNQVARESRRGPANVLLCHPDFFENTTAKGSIGRWTEINIPFETSNSFMVNDVRYYVSEVIPKNEIILSWRGENESDAPGLVKLSSDSDGVELFLQEISDYFPCTSWATKLIIV